MAHTSQNALDWSGTYSGTLPCASCPGIQTTLVLNEDGTYQLTTHYRDEAKPNTVKNVGTFSWDDNGQVITLNNQEAPNQYFLGENYLAKLDMEGQRITGELAEQYVLRKE
ncbi:copper resistance protein NlpE [Gracilimonas mengyeensis]|uniref:copper resistance protein NlpE n=1 Tax=Gracilimonas mengyeensis TaxID=1302730 RepID=UPI001FE99680|nr:copper resistance protein NlpE [Gracilimonas mengyeensis]